MASTLDREPGEDGVGQSRIEKIAQRHAVDLPEEHEVRAGDFIGIRPFHVMTHDDTGDVIPRFLAVGARKVFDPGQPVIALDRDVQNRTPGNLEMYAGIEAFASEQGIAFFGAGCGTGHQLMLEEGFVLPGTFVVASDAHANTYGALGALGTQVTHTDAAAIWAAGQAAWQVPDVARVTLTGRLRQGVSGKDLILSLIGLFNQGEAHGCAIEFEGEGVGSLSMDQRMTVANMTAEWGAIAACFPFDGLTRAWLLYRAAEMMRRGDRKPRLTVELVEQYGLESPVADPDAHYARMFTIDIGSVTPVVAGPDGLCTVTPLFDMESKRIAVQKAYLLPCSNGRLEDLAEAAAVLRGRRVASGVKLYLAAASRSIREEARRLGYWDTLLEAGATELPPGCGPCSGLGEGLLEAGEVGISSTNRNCRGMMGSPDSTVYLASPAVVAASAAEGYIAASAPVRSVPLSGSYEE